MKKDTVISLTICLFIAVLPLTVQAQDEENIQEIFKKVTELTEQQKFPQAIVELGWAEKALQKKNAEKLTSFFPETLADFKADSMKTNAALGMTTVERVYKKEKLEVKVSLTGGSRPGLGNSLAGIAQMGAMLGAKGAGGMNSFRLDGQTANLNVNENRKKADLTVFLGSGSILKLEMKNGTDSDALKSMVKGLKVGEINDYLKADG